VPDSASSAMRDTATALSAVAPPPPSSAVKRNTPAVFARPSLFARPPTIVVGPTSVFERTPAPPAVFAKGAAPPPVFASGAVRASCSRGFDRSRDENSSRVSAWRDDGERNGKSAKDSDGRVRVNPTQPL